VAIVFNQAVQLDVNAVTIALHTNNVTYNGVAQPNGKGTLPTSLSVGTIDNVTWIVTFNGNTDNGKDGLNSIKDGVYDLRVDATKVHPVGVPALGMAASSLTTFHRLFGDIDAPAATPGPGGTTDFLARVTSIDNLAMTTAFNRPLAYNAALDFNGDGAITSLDNLFFRLNFNRPLTWRV
jgi:hypothetical protein